MDDQGGACGLPARFQGLCGSHERSPRGEKSQRAAAQRLGQLRQGFMHRRSVTCAVLRQAGHIPGRQQHGLLSAVEQARYLQEAPGLTYATVSAQVPNRPTAVLAGTAWLDGALVPFGAAIMAMQSDPGLARVGVKADGRFGQLQIGSPPSGGNIHFLMDGRRASAELT